MKKIAIALVVLIVATGIGLLTLYSSLDGIVKHEIEKYGSAATQTKVSLDGVSIDVRSGEATLTGLKVANPKGYSGADAFALQSIHVKLDTASIRGDGPVIIRMIDVEHPTVDFELLNSGENNLQAIGRNTQSHAKPADTNHDPSGKPERKLIVNILSIKNGRVVINQQMMPGKPITTDLPPIQMSAIGNESGGATGSEIATKVVNALVASALQSALTELAKQKISGVLKDVPAASIGKAGMDALGGQLQNIIGK